MVGENGANGRSARTPGKAPKGIAVPAASATAIDRHPRTGASGVWATVTKSPIAPDTADGPNGRPGRPARRRADWRSRHVDDRAAIRSRPSAEDFASVPIAMRFIAPAIRRVRSSRSLRSTGSGPIGATGASAQRRAEEDSARD